MRFLHIAISGIACLMAANLVPALTRSFAQMPHDRWELPSILGESTIEKDAQPNPHLPEGAKILGEIDWDRDGRPEIFVVKSNPVSQFEFENHLVVFRNQADGGTRLDREYVIRDNRMDFVYFYKPPDARDRMKVIAWARGGAYWGTAYLLQSDIAFPVQLGSVTDSELLDLNSDGLYEAVAWDRRPDDRRCVFGLFGVRVMPRIYARAGKGYQCIWPMQTAPWHEVMSQFADVDDDGRPEIVSLEDNGRNETGAQRLSIYKMEGSKFRMLARAAAPWPNIAVLLSTSETGILELETATQQRCKQGADANGLGTTKTRYQFRDGALRRLQ